MSKVVQLLAVTGVAEGLISQPKFLRVGQVTANTLHISLAVRAALPLFIGFGMTFLARGRVDTQLHNPRFRVAFNVRDMTGFTGDYASRSLGMR
jgi:hypothetical protein